MKPALQRVAVFGLPGTGKTTFARRLAALLEVPHYELDAFLFKPGGVAPLEEFRAEVAKLTDADAWIVDGNYSKLRDVTWWRAEVVVWLDYGLPVIVWRVARRDLRRILARERLWDGQRMTWRRAFFGRRSVLGNAVRKWLQNRGKYRVYVERERPVGVAVLRFRSPRAAHPWLAEHEHPAVRT